MSWMDGWTDNILLEICGSVTHTIEVFLLEIILLNKYFI